MTATTTCTAIIDWARAPEAAARALLSIQAIGNYQT